MTFVMKGKETEGKVMWVDDGVTGSKECGEENMFIVEQKGGEKAAS